MFRVNKKDNVDDVKPKVFFLWSTMAGKRRTICPLNLIWSLILDYNLVTAAYFRSNSTLDPRSPTVIKCGYRVQPSISTVRKHCKLDQTVNIPA